MTANAMKGDREQCLDAGMNDYLAKPVDPTALAAMIEKWVDMKTRTDATRETSIRPRDNGLDQDAGQVFVNLDSALQRAMGDKDFLKMIFDEFFKGVEEQLQAIANALQGSDGNLLRQAAHKFKGAAANLGLEQVAAAALALETIGRTDVMDGGAQALSDLEQTVHQSITYIKNVDWSQVNGAN